MIVILPDILLVYLYYFLFAINKMFREKKHLYYPLNHLFSS